MRNFIVVGTSERVITAVVQAIHCFSKAKTIIIGDKETHNLKWSGLCSKHFCFNFDLDNDDKIIRLINNIYAAAPDVIVIPADCNGIRLVNRIKKKIYPKITPIPETEAFQQMDDKWSFYNFCKENEITVPETFFVGTKEAANFNEIVSRVGLPFVIKPSNESGSFGVQIIQSENHYLTEVMNNDEYKFKSLIVQRYIEGEDIDISLLVIMGKISAFAIQQSDGASIQFVQNFQLQSLAAKLCAKNAFHGLMHIDARMEGKTGNIYLIESNPRFWASLNAAIWCGLNFVEESIKNKSSIDEPLCLVSGVAYTKHPILRPAAWSSFFNIGPRGRLTRTAILDAYMLARFVSDLPTILGRNLSQFASYGFRAIRNAYALFGTQGVAIKALGKSGD